MNPQYKHSPTDNIRLNKNKPLGREIKMEILIQTVTYNREHLLPRTVESVLAQTFTDFTYMIIDNGSTDGTQASLDVYSKQDPRIVVVSQPNNSMSPDSVRERYRWIREFPAPYFMRVDDDDYMEPNTVETLHKLVTEHNADAACVGSRFVFSDGSIRDKHAFKGTYVYNRKEAMVEMLKREKFNVALGGKLLRREVLDIVYPDVEKIRDIHISYRRMYNISKMVVTGEPLYYFYRHDGNVSGLETVKQITPEKMRQHLEANTMRTQWLTEHMPEIADYVLYSELSFMISLYERIHRLDVQDCFGIAQEMRDTLMQHSAFLSALDYCTEREKGILKTMDCIFDRE
jgi:glycosyltransferase involved in cell wall biosynthesis